MTLFFSKYAGYVYGGAEKSLEELVKRCDDSTEILSFSFPRLKPITYANVRLLKVGVKLPRFPFLEFFLNLLILPRLVRVGGVDRLVTYGVGGILGQFFVRAKYREHYFRSANEVLDFGWRSRSPVFALELLYRLAEGPFYLAYSVALRTLKRKVSFISNSRYIARRAEKAFGISSSVMYPPISIAATLPTQEPVFDVLFVGSTWEKGKALVQEISRLLPNCSFLVIDKTAPRQNRVGNIEYWPWMTSMEKTLLQARMVIVPSQWVEAFGRIAAEAVILGIPVLVSNRGGLPEAVGDDRRRIVFEYWDPRVWAQRIEGKLEELRHL